MKKLQLISFVSLFLITSILGSMNAQEKKVRKVNIKTFHETFVCCNQSNGGKLFGDRKDAKEWETFTIIYVGPDRVNIKASNDKYVSLNKEGYLVAGSLVAQSKETFTIVPINENWVAFKAANGKFICADKKQKFMLYANRENVGDWESFNIIDVK
jgi:hypothetical protein